MDRKIQEVKWWHVLDSLNLGDTLASILFNYCQNVTHSTSSFSVHATVDSVLYKIEPSAKLGDVSEDLLPERSPSSSFCLVLCSHSQCPHHSPPHCPQNLQSHSHTHQNQRQLHHNRKEYPIPIKEIRL